MTQDQGASAEPTGLSQAEPKGSALRASIPSADGSNWTRKVIAVWERWNCGKYTAFKTQFDGPWLLRDERGIILGDESLQTVMAHAQAIEARRANLSLSNDASAAVQPDTPGSGA